MGHPVASTAAPLRYAKTSDGVSIAYLTVGSGPPLVFASNILGEAHLYRSGWSNVRATTDGLAAAGWTVVRHDHRGMGGADRNVADLSLEGRVRDLEAVVEKLGFERFVLAGVDFGAATAMAYAAAHPSAVSRLVLISPWVAGSRWFALPAVRVVTAASPSEDDEWETFSGVLGSVVTGFDDPQLSRQIATAMRQATSSEGFFAYHEASRGIDLSNVLPRLAMPALVVHDPTFPFGSLELCREVATSVPQASLVMLGDRSLAGRVHTGLVEVIDQFGRCGTVEASVPASEVNQRVLSQPDGLTPREAQALSLVAAGLSNKEIAGELRVALATIERHLVNSYAKIGARGRADATAYALRRGLAKRL